MQCHAGQMDAGSGVSVWRGGDGRSGTGAGGPWVQPYAIQGGRDIERRQVKLPRVLDLISMGSLSMPN